MSNSEIVASMDNDTMQTNYSLVWENSTRPTFQRSPVLGTLIVFTQLYVPSVIIVGLIGNAFLVLTILLSHLKSIPSNIYLVAMAISDSCFLLGLAVIWLEARGVNLYNVNGGCQLVVFNLNSSNWFSTWLIVIITVERFIAVYHPLLKLILDRRRPVLIVLAVLPFPVLFNIWSLVTMAVDKEGNCNYLAEYIRTATILTYVDTVFVFIIPTGLISGLNVAISIRLLAHWKSFDPQCSRISRGTTNCSPAVAKSGRPSGRRSHMVDNNFKITRTLLVITTVFVILNLPSYVLRCKNIVLTAMAGNITLSETELIGGQISTLLYYSSFGANFFVYAGSSQGFRHSSVSVWKHLLRRRTTAADFDTSYRRHSMPLSALPSMRHNAPRAGSLGRRMSSLRQSQMVPILSPTGQTNPNSAIHDRQQNGSNRGVRLNGSIGCGGGVGNKAKIHNFERILGEVNGGTVIGDCDKPLLETGLCAGEFKEEKLL